MSRAVAEPSWELVTGEGVVRVSADHVDAATSWGLHDPAGRSPDELDLPEDELPIVDLF
jgi:hypothetical protein